MRIVFVTTDAPWVVEGDADRPHHDAAFAELGLELAHRPWGDADTDWAAFDLVVLRSPWDYPTRLDAFLAWLDEVTPLPTLQNPGALVRWNLDKHYLADLAAHGVPIVPTTFAESLDAAVAAIDACDAAEVVVKPTVSAGSRHTGRFATGDPAAADLARTILVEGGRVMVEPFITSVATAGESASICIDGTVAHTVRKGPILETGGGLVGGTYREDVTPVPATVAEVAVVDATQRAVEAIAHDAGWLPPEARLLYARYDVVTLDDGSAALLEAELFEPTLFLRVAPAAAAPFARACRARAERLAADRRR